MPTESNTDEQKQQPRGLWSRCKRLLHSSRGKDVLIFVLFLLVSYVFWVVMSLNDDMQRDVSIGLEITDVPRGTTFISVVPANLNINVRDKGAVLANYKWGGLPQLRLSYKDFTYDDRTDRIVLGKQDLESKVRSLFSSSTQLLSIRPDSLSLVVTDSPGVRAKVHPDIEVTPSAQSVISGPIRIQPDSVTVYSARKMPIAAREVRTMHVVRNGLTDTLVMEVRLHPESGTRIVPDRVRVTVPVEPLISKKRTVAIELINDPEAEGKNVVVFPSQVTVDYLVPMSHYSTESGVISVQADFRNRSNTHIPLSLAPVPEYYQGVTLSTDSVEYLIENTAAMPLGGGGD